MGATGVTGSYNSIAFFSSSLSKPPPFHKILLLSPQFNKITVPLICSQSMSPRSVSSPETSVVAQEQEEEEGAEQSDSSSSASLPSLTGGCKGCGREEIERGCNGEGRIQGGIATVPGFGWWPIKAYRPCPAYLQSGGRYRRTGQSMDQVVSGRPSSSSSRQKKDPSKS